MRRKTKKSLRNKQMGGGDPEECSTFSEHDCPDTCKIDVHGDCINKENTDELLRYQLPIKQLIAYQKLKITIQNNSTDIINEINEINETNTKELVTELIDNLQKATSVSEFNSFFVTYGFNMAEKARAVIETYS